MGDTHRFLPAPSSATAPTAIISGRLRIDRMHVAAATTQQRMLWLATAYDLYPAVDFSAAAATPLTKKKPPVLLSSLMPSSGLRLVALAAAELTLLKSLVQHSLV